MQGFISAFGGGLCGKVFCEAATEEDEEVVETRVVDSDKVEIVGLENVDDAEGDSVGASSSSLNFFSRSLILKLVIQ